MSNPWLSVPLADYEGHMSAQTVAQLEVLSELFAEAISDNPPPSLAIVGVAGGNGLEHVHASTTRVVGIDINPAYLEAVRDRYAQGRSLELHCRDLAEHGHQPIQSVAWVHAALIFEHAGLDPCLANAIELVAPDGMLSVVLQLPTQTSQDVAATRFPSMQSLRHDFQLIDPQQFCARVTSHGLTLVRESRRPLPGGKAFWMGIFHRAL